MRVLLAGCVALMLLPAAAGFSSLPPGASPHDDITGVAAEVGWSRDAVKALQQAVRAPDLDDMEFEPTKNHPARFDATEAYLPEHHCERVPPATNADAFAASSAYVLQQREIAGSAAAAAPKEAMAALGRALHALQDCYSHSNVVDMGESAQAALQLALLSGGTAPAQLRLTGFLPGTEDPDMPEGDAYPHGDFAKDLKDYTPEAKVVLPDGRTKYAAAYQLAENATLAFLRAFDENLTPQARAALMSVEPQRDGGIDRLPIAAPGVALLAIALVGVALLRRR